MAADARGRAIVDDYQALAYILESRQKGLLKDRSQSARRSRKDRGVRMLNKLDGRRCTKSGVLSVRDHFCSTEAK